ncbi:MAG: class I tRNA ligase family protein, partial [Candidatus Saccharimonadales bacterium]|nr:class I tRNA ligase family protein [Candidatus Saccharimonadales bacterium]
TDKLTHFRGMNVFEANDHVIDHLKNQGTLFKQEEYAHMYPHCWRTDNPLIYRAVSSWMVDVPSFKEQIIEKNEEINWVPDNVKYGAFGKWIEGARVWNISRDRFWGAPIPIWKTDDGEVLVIGSLKELKERLVDPNQQIDLHKPAIDDIILKTDSGKEAKRVPEVFDCWFESGSMPFAQHNYPFSGAEKLQHPADFIVEYIGQVRGWFYTLHVLSTALFDKPAFTNAISHGVILGSDSRKMSKKLGNYPDLNHVFNDYGADSLRYYLFESPVMSGETVAINEKSIIDAQRNVFMTLYNSFKFFKTYADIDGWKPPKELKEPKSDQPLDAWMLSRLNETIAEVTSQADAYDVPKAVRPLRKLIDDLSNWYIRRSRRRFWKSENDADKETAYQVLWYVLMRVSQIMAPWAPFISDHMWRELANDTMAESVHLTDWPEAGAVNQRALETMAEVREAISLGLAQRADSGIKVRQPLSSISVVLKSAVSSELESLIADECNVKKTTVSTGDKVSAELDTEITTDLKHEGQAREIIRRVQNFRKKSGLNVEDRIDLSLQTDDNDLQAAIKKHGELIENETLSKLKELKETDHHTTVKVDSAELNIALKKSGD